MFNLSNLAEARPKVVRMTLGCVITYLFMVIMNFLANYLPINDILTQEISDKYYNIFTPAGFTFIIWGVIYLLLGLLIIFLVRGVLKRRERPERVVKAIAWPFMISSLLNGVWILAWHYDQILLSTVLMLGILVALIKLYVNLKNLYFRSKKYLIPFSVYLGWITVATVANITVLTVALEWGQFGLADEFWLGVVLLATIVITGYMLFRQQDVVFGLVILWAVTGIFAARLQEAEGLSAAAALALVTGILVVIMIVQSKRREKSF